jgi:hypothetical protein
MTDDTPGGWPDAARPGYPLNPERDGWHWVMMREGVPFRPRACFWDASRPGWAVPGSAKLREDAGPEWRYLAPCHTPAEVSAQVEAARREEREACARIFDKHGAASQKLADMRVSEQDNVTWQAHADDMREYAAAIRARGDA